MTSYSCTFCRLSGFLDRSALKTHQVRNGLCLSQQRAAQREAQMKTNDEIEEEVNHVNVNREDGRQEVETRDDPDLDAYGNLFCNLYDDAFLNQERKEFDVTFQTVFFIRQCHNGSGLSQKDINQLLRLLLYPKFDRKKLSVRNIADVLKYEQGLKNESDEWKEVEILAETEHSPKIELFSRDLVQVLQSLYSSNKNQEGFALRASVEEDGSARLYTNLQSGEWWGAMDEDVEASCKGGIAPIILYSDQTSLSHNKRTQGWPLVMTLGNISCNLRSLPEGHCLLAILPMTGSNDPGVLDKRMSSRTKLELLHKCQDIILGPLKEASYSGLHPKDPFENSQWVFPRLCLYICDQPEGSKMTCTYDSNKSNFPCSTCFVPKKSLSVVTKFYPYKTEQGMKEIFNNMQQMSLEEREVICREQSIHAVKSALWGFCGGELLQGNPYRCIQVDGLHQSIVGIFKTLVGIVRTSAPSTALITHPLRELDRRLMKIHKDCWYASFQLPGTCQAGYFQSNANFHGFEHKFVMQVVVFCLLGVIPDDMIKVFIHFIDWYLLAFRSKAHSTSSLEEMDRLMVISVAAMKKYAETWQKSGFDLVKVHWMAHLKDCIKRCGLPAEYDTGIFEHMHIALMKVPFRCSNKRNFMGQIVRHNQRMRILLDEANLQDTDLRIHQEDVTALDRAVNTGQNVLSGKAISLNLDCFEGNLGESRNDSLPQEVEGLFNDQPELQHHFMLTFLRYLKDESYQQPRKLQTWKNLAITAGEGDRFADWPMYTRACSNFHGRPWFGYVQLQMEAAGMDPVVWFGQVRLYFSCELSDGAGKKIMKSLAFIRIMTQLRRDQHWKLMQCDKLKFVDEVAVNSNYSTRRKDDHQSQPTTPYIVMDIANITRVVHVVPNFTQEGMFFLNRFKM